MKKTILRILCCSVTIFSAPMLHAQYQNDYTSYYSDPTDAVTNDAIYKDAPNSVYYIAQRDITTHQIMITMADPNFNPLAAYKYSCLTSSFYPTVTDIDEVTSLQHLVIIGTYIIEGSQQGSFMMCVDKLTGAFLWFQTFPDIDYLRSCVTYNSASGTAGIIAVGYRSGSGFQYAITGRSGFMICVDAAAGAVNWAKDIESAKYVGNTVGVTSVANRLSDITKIDDNTFVATGVFDEPAAAGTVFDGDGALIEFDASGTMINESALGDPLGLNSPGPRPFLYKKAEAITYDPIDNTVMIAGNALQGIHYPGGTVCAVQTGASGLWVTKVSMSSYATMWSNIYSYYTNPYSVYAYFDAGNMHITCDNSGNYGVNFYSQFDQTTHGPTPYAGNVPIIKLEPTAGNIIYSRDYTSVSNDGFLNDICSSFTNNNIVGVGSLTTTPANTGWNVEAFDNILTQCQSYNFPLVLSPSPYVPFSLADQLYSEAPGSLLFSQSDEKLALNIICPEIYVGPKPGRNNSMSVQQQASNNKVDINYDIADKLVNININDDETYSVMVINTWGQTIRKFENIKNQYTVNVNNLTPGVYYIDLYNENNRQSKIIPVQ